MAGAGDLPAALKICQPFIKSANDFQARDPVVSYYCKRYALELAVAEQGRTKDKTLLKAILPLMDEVEATQIELSSREEITQDVVGKAHMENMTLRIFARADNQDRTGEANITTAGMYRTAAVLLEALNTFGDSSPDMEEKRKYAKYRAVYIAKCIKQGTTPIPPDVDGEDELEPDNMDEDNTITPQRQSPFANDPPAPPPPPAFSNLGNVHQPPPSAPAFHNRPSSNTPPPPPPPPSHPSLPPSQPSPMSSSPPPAQHGDSPYAPAPSASAPAYATNYASGQRRVKDMSELRADDIKRVEKLARFVQSALQYDDVATAVKNLEEALNILTH